VKPAVAVDWLADELATGAAEGGTEPEADADPEGAAEAGAIEMDPTAIWPATAPIRERPVMNDLIFQTIVGC
jgi:hypothetical protein